MYKWVSVEERLPDAQKDVWVYGKDGVTIGYWIYLTNKKMGGLYWSDVYGDNDGMRNDTIYDVTHWMPMDKPEPPSC